MQFLNEDFQFPSCSPAVAAPTNTERADTPNKRKSHSLCEPSPKKLKTDCQKCRKRRVVLKKTMSANKVLKKNLNNSFFASAEKKALKQSLQRKQNIELKLRAERRDLRNKLMKKNPEIKRLQRNNGTELKAKRKHKCNHSSKLADAVKELSSLKKNLKELQNENEGLRAIILEEENERQTTAAKKDNKTFSNGYRKAAYNCLLNQVPVEATGTVIRNVVKEITGLTVDEKADAATVSQFAYELGVLNDVQVCETIMKEDNLTLGWDATSLRGEHVNEVHLMFPGEPPRGLELQINSLSGGTTADYAQHTSESLSDVSDTYALCHGVERLDVQKTVLSKLKNTISDRDSVNHCVRKELEENLDVQLLELKCNVHPLDGIAHGARKTLKLMEQKHNVKGELWGRNCCADNVNYALSKMRYKQGKGDPKGFKEFLKKEEIKSKTIVRYVGNRMHVLFHLAGVFYSLRTKLITYLEDYCNNTALIPDQGLH